MLMRGPHQAVALCCGDPSQGQLAMRSRALRGHLDRACPKLCQALRCKSTASFLHFLYVIIHTLSGELNNNVSGSCKGNSFFMVTFADHLAHPIPTPSS